MYKSRFVNTWKTWKIIIPLILITSVVISVLNMDTADLKKYKDTIIEKFIDQEKLDDFYKSTGSSWNSYYYMLLSIVPIILMILGKKNDSLLCYGFILLIPSLAWIGGYTASGEQKDAILPTDFYWNIMKGAKGRWDDYEVDDISRTVIRTFLFIAILVISCYTITKKVFKMNLLKSFIACSIFILVIFPVLSKLIIHDCVIDNAMVEQYYKFPEIIGLQMSANFGSGLKKQFGGLLIQIINLVILFTLYIVK